jgi:hypothetical protein
MHHGRVEYYESSLIPSWGNRPRLASPAIVDDTRNSWARICPKSWPPWAPFSRLHISNCRHDSGDEKHPGG